MAFSRVLFHEQFQYLQRGPSGGRRGHLEVGASQRPPQHRTQVLFVLAGRAPLDGVMPCATRRAQGPRSDSGPRLGSCTAAPGAQSDLRSPRQQPRRILRSPAWRCPRSYRGPQLVRPRSTAEA